MMIIHVGGCTINKGSHKKFEGVRGWKPLETGASFEALVTRPTISGHPQYQMIIELFPDILDSKPYGKNTSHW